MVDSATTAPPGSALADPPPALTRAIVAAYSLPNLGLGAMIGLLLIYFMKFATDVLLIAPAVTGAIFGAARLWDAVSDPLAGHLSDRTRSSLGRRRPWLLASAAFLPLGFLGIFAPPQGLSQVELVAWVTVAIFFLHTALTVFEVPYRALGAELCEGYHERTRVFAGSSLAGHVGGLFAVACLAAIERSADPRAAVAMAALPIAVLTGLFIAVGTARMREPSAHSGRGGVSLRLALRDVWRNPHARVILTARFCQELALASSLGLLPFVSEYALRTPGWTAYYLAAGVVGVLVSIPVWVVVSRRFGKRESWIGAAVLNLGVFVLFFTLGEGDAPLLLVGMFFAGAAGACASVVAPSLCADVIDYDEHLTGERKEGAYFAVWNFVEKAAVGLKFIAVGALLQATGFEPNQEQSDLALFGLRLAVAGIPCAGMLVVLPLLVRFRLDEEAHRALRRDA